MDKGKNPIQKKIWAFHLIDYRMKPSNYFPKIAQPFHI